MKDEGLVPRAWPSSFILHAHPSSPTNAAEQVALLVHGGAPDPAISPAIGLAGRKAGVAVTSKHLEQEDAEDAEEQID